MPPLIIKEKNIIWEPFVIDLMNGKLSFKEQEFLQGKKYILTMEVRVSGLKVKKVITI